MRITEIKEGVREIIDVQKMRYRIWSFEHKMWWKPGSRGYTKDINEAGLYNLKEAYKICLDANIVGVNEAMVPVLNEAAMRVEE